MTPHEPERPEERAFVEKVRETYVWPERGEAERAAFRARVKERVAQPPRRGLVSGPTLAAATAFGLALLLFWSFDTEQEAPPLPVTAVPEAPTTRPVLPLPEAPIAVGGTDAGVDDAGAALLALADLSDAVEQESSLPADYQAIASLFLEGV